MNERSIFTRAVHAGESRGTQKIRATVEPIYASTTFLADTPEELDAVLGGAAGYSYARYENPNAGAAATAVADLEGGGQALGYASGMAAIAAALTAVPLEKGDTVLAAQDLYGASILLLQNVLGPLGLHPVFADLTDTDAARHLVKRHHPRAILVETISNPLLRIVDGPALADMAREHGSSLLVDNTFATPLLQNPLDWGATAVIHSATKYLSGHGDVTAGVVVTRDHGYFDRLAGQVKLTGAMLGPFEAWLLHRGVKTLPIRFERQCASAVRIADRLAASGLFARVIHPLRPDHPHHDRALALYPRGRCGAVVTLDLGGDRERTFRFLSALDLVLPVTTVGDVYTLCLYPAISSHRGLTPEERERIGITDSTVRIAVGIEDPDEIAADIEQAARRSRTLAR